MIKVMVRYRPQKWQSMGKPISGRPLTTGRFDTRRELLERIRFLWQDTSCRQADIARNCRVSPPTVSMIIERCEWKKHDDCRWLDQGDMTLHDEAKIEPFEPTENLSHVDLAACGHGWSPVVASLPAEVLRELDMLDYVNYVTVEENTLN